MLKTRKKRNNESRNLHKCKNCSSCSYCLGGYKSCENCKKCENCILIKKIRHNISNRIRIAVKNKNSKKLNNSLKLTGCTLKEFINWIEYNFNSNMSWDNYGTYWELDHVIPTAFFDLLDINSQKKCFNWSNIQPLECSKNILKSSKINYHTILMQELKVKFYKRKKI